MVSDAGTVAELQASVRVLRDALKERARTMQTTEEELRRVLKIVETVNDQGLQLQEILQAKKADAELQTIVIGAFPPDKLSELSGTIAAVLAGGGGASYGFTGGSVTGLVVASVLWGVAGGLLAVTLLWRADHQRAWRREWTERLGRL